MHPETLDRNVKGGKKNPEGLSAFAEALAEALRSTGMSQAALADQIGAGRSAVSAWMQGSVEPHFRTVFAMEAALSLPGGYLSQHLGCVPAGEPVAGHDVESAIATDPDLDEQQRHMLLKVRAAFLAVNERDAR